MSNRFVPRCSLEVFTQEEVNILEQYGSWLGQLMRGELSPQTTAQEQFVQLANGACQPITIYEKTWRKYLDRLTWEKENKELMGERRRMPNDREDWKRMRGAVWSEIRHRSRGLD